MKRDKKKVSFSDMPSSDPPAPEPSSLNIVRRQSQPAPASPIPTIEAKTCDSDASHPKPTSTQPTVAPATRPSAVTNKERYGHHSQDWHAMFQTFWASSKHVIQYPILTGPDNISWLLAEDIISVFYPDSRSDSFTATSTATAEEKEDQEFERRYTVPGGMTVSQLTSTVVKLTKADVYLLSEVTGRSFYCDSGLLAANRQDIFSSRHHHHRRPPGTLTTVLFVNYTIDVNRNIRYNALHMFVVHKTTAFPVILEYFTP
ncbi:hypothetical protein GE061_020279 [Apolygus lucorum]|uniref:Uncharacterized protein n=1 Tax=Apolygus lucorum TaxID=248454 RepID=A0A6A4IVK2_APOLU|nr:hypothetical protein GE061_020279 [Apolygus lucorum]